MSRDAEISKGIVVNPLRMGGKPTVRGTRISAEMVLNLASGDSAMTAAELVDSYPSLTYSDVSNVLAYGRRIERGEKRLESWANEMGWT